MRRRRRRRVMAQINITPFTDVCLVLLIIFMVASSFLATDAAFNLRLPSAATAEIQERNDYIVISVDREGGCFVGAEPVAQAELLSILEGRRADYGDRPIVIKCDDQASWGEAVRVMDIIRMAGFDHIAIATNVKDLEK